MSTLTSSRFNRVIFVALTNILLITALVSLVSNSLTEVSDAYLHRTSMVDQSRPQKHGQLSVCGADYPTKKAPASVATVSHCTDRLI